MTDYVYGFKVLDPTGCTYYNGKVFQYHLPGPGEKWAVTEHPSPAKPDGKACGAGRLHIHCKLTFEYGPRAPWPWFARARREDVVGSDSKKFGATRIELRRISPRVFARMLRLGWGRPANLRWANLSGADLSWANLRGAYLYGVNLSGANLDGANLDGAYLYGVNLSGANLSGADLDGANLSGAIWDEHTRWPDGFTPGGKGT